MTKHIITAKMISVGRWILFNKTTDEPIGEEHAYQYDTRKAAYIAASQMWPDNSTWHGHRVHGGYSIEVD